MIFKIGGFFLAAFFLMVAEGAVASSFNTVFGRCEFIYPYPDYCFNASYNIPTIDYWESCLIMLAILGIAVVFKSGFTLVDMLKDLSFKVTTAKKDEK